MVRRQAAMTHASRLTARSARVSRIRFPLTCDREHLLRRVIDLERGVLDVEALAQHLFDLTADGVAVGAACHQDVRRQYRDTGRNLPQMEIVHLAHEGRMRHGPPDLLRSRSLRCTLE